jgi:ABC-type Fe2+-enterobactin transport system substrate-binding protein
MSKRLLRAGASYKKEIDALNAQITELREYLKEIAVEAGLPADVLEIASCRHIAHQVRMMRESAQQHAEEMHSKLTTLQAKLEAAEKDAARLDFMIAHSAWVAHSKDGECCRCFHTNDDGEAEPMTGWGVGKNYNNGREAIDAARTQNGKG